MRMKYQGFDIKVSIASISRSTTPSKEWPSSKGPMFDQSSAAMRVALSKRFEFPGTGTECRDYQRS